MGMESLLLLNHDYVSLSQASPNPGDVVLGQHIRMAVLTMGARPARFNEGQVVYTDDSEAVRLVAVGGHISEVLGMVPFGANPAASETKLKLLIQAAGELGYRLVRKSTSTKSKATPPVRSESDEAKRTAPRAQERRGQPRRGRGKKAP